MSPSLAAALTALFIIGLFRVDGRGKERRSAALWIPVAWLVVTGSRFVSQWLTLGQPIDPNVTDGSTIDALFFAACITASAVVLLRRHVQIADLLKDNGWIVAFLLFALLSVIWSDFPFVALKRWIKVLGHPLVALVILTDPNPRRALVTVMKRCAFLLLPISVLFIKYYPEFGRGFDPWTGEGYYQGVGLNKNYLGYLSMTFALFFVWYLLTVRKLEDNKQRRIETVLTWILIGMAAWLLLVSDSATSLATAVIGVVTVFLLGWRAINRRHLAWYIAVVVIAAALIEVMFDPYATIVAMLGRDPSLTDRTEVWADALALQPNALVGAGFESFWLGSRLDTLWQKWWWRPNQAHNGYIEMYLNLGLIGVIVFAGMLLSTFRKICRLYAEDSDTARMRMAFFLVVLFYNYTEAAFKGVHFMWTIFYIVALTYTAPRAEKAITATGGTVKKMRPFAPPAPARRENFDGIGERRPHRARRELSS